MSLHIVSPKGYPAQTTQVGIYVINLVSLLQMNGKQQIKSQNSVNSFAEGKWSVVPLYPGGNPRFDNNDGIEKHLITSVSFLHCFLPGLVTQPFKITRWEYLPSPFALVPAPEVLLSQSSSFSLYISTSFSFLWKSDPKRRQDTHPTKNDANVCPRLAKDCN